MEHVDAMVSFKRPIAVIWLVAALLVCAWVLWGCGPRTTLGPSAAHLEEASRVCQHETACMHQLLTRWASEPAPRMPVWGGTGSGWAAPAPVGARGRPLVAIQGSRSTMRLQRGAVPGTYYQPGPGGPRWISVQPLP